MLSALIATHACTATSCYRTCIWTEL